MKLLLLVPAVCIVLFVAGCGGDDDDQALPSGTAARVGDFLISEAEVDRAQHGPLQPATGTNLANLDGPPHYKDCMQAKKGLDYRASQPSDADFKRQCAVEFHIQRALTVKYLIRAEWLARDAKRQGVYLSDAEVQKTFMSQVAPTESFEATIKRAGVTRHDLGLMVRPLESQERLLKRIPLSDAEIKAYYERQKQADFGTPSHRDAQVLLATTKADALAARRAVQHGMSWNDAIRRYSKDEALRAQSGLLTLIKDEQGNPRLVQAVFSVQKGTVVGPRQTDRGWYVFEVTRIQPAQQLALSKVRTTIEDALRRIKQNEQLGQRYDRITTCSKRYWIPEVWECTGKNPVNPAA